MKRISKRFIAQVEQELGYSDFTRQASLWDKKLLRLDDEILFYIQMKVKRILNNRAKKY